jgi:selT/selW/selH-like putative selenoprotein
MVLWVIFNGVKSLFQQAAPANVTAKTVVSKTVAATTGAPVVKMPDMFKIQDQELYERNRDKTFDLHVQYCGGWGYGKRYNIAHEHIMKLYPNAKVTGTSDTQKTQNFVVKINDEYVIYDKKANNDEPMDTKTMEKIIDNMNKILKVY